MKVTKSVTLDVETAKLAKEMDNFSLYIRQCLKGSMHIEYEQLTRQVKHLLNVIRIARDLGSQHPTFKKCLERMII